MKLVVGLGNPGLEYENTRHNIGFMAVDRFLSNNNIEAHLEPKFQGILGSCTINGEKALILKPVTFMNLSGESVIKVVNFYKIKVEDILVICDDLDSRFSRIRCRAKGSAGGHNGIKSIISHTGTQNFKRVRVGVGEKPARMDLADYVLGHFSKEDVPIMEDAFKDAADAVSIIISQDINAAMNKYN
jgi:PTH1 family peptidyl-tRNA hydrolase